MRAYEIFCTFVGKMKIIGFSQIESEVRMVLKGDSSLLVNRKPFFVPDWSEQVLMTPCVVLRVSRLGKHVASRFASRYYDAVAVGLNMRADDMVARGEWTAGWAFDYSLVVGRFVGTDMLADYPTVISPEEAIERVSKVMTIRQGDMIFIDCQTDARALVREEVICVQRDDNEILYCKIK